MQFDAFLLGISEKIQKVKNDSIWHDKADAILDKIAPILVNEAGKEKMDLEAGIETMKAEVKKLEKIFQYGELMHKGVAHELEMLKLLGKMGQTAVDADEGETALSLETQRLTVADP